MNLIKAEFRKPLTEAISYYPDYIVGLITDFFVLIIVINTEGNTTEKVFGYILWILASGVISEASMCISTEKQLGTLQNIMIKPYSIAQIVTVKTIVWFSINVIKAIITMVVAMIFFGIDNLFRLEYLYIVILVCIGIMGLSYVLASVTLMFTKVASFVNIISYGFLFLSGSIVKIPDFLVYTNPISYGVKYASVILKNGIWVMDTVIFLIICGSWLLVGYLIFRFMFNRCKQFKWTY